MHSYSIYVVAELAELSNKYTFGILMDWVRAQTLAKVE